MTVASARVTPRSPLRLPSRQDHLASGDRAREVRRLIHVGDEPVLLSAAWAGGQVALRAEAETADAAEAGWLGPGSGRASTTTSPPSWSASPAIP